MKTVGVLGGMGPLATVDFFARLVRATTVNREQDHLHVIIDNNPSVPDRQLAIAGTGPSSGPELAQMARRLDQAGADFLVMPCNTAHAFKDEIRAATRLPFIDMVEETVRAASTRSSAGDVGVLAADGCLTAGLYQKQLARIGRAAVILSAAKQSRFMDLIYRIKAGTAGPESSDIMRELSQALIDKGARSLIAACTEVPLVLDAPEFDVPLLVSTDVLVTRTVEFGRT